MAAGCGTIDHNYPRTESYVLQDTADTYFGRAISPNVAEMPADQSGFYPLSDGIEALAARLLLAERAEISIDAQYYLIKNDVVGRAFMYDLLQAADRGVRVRLLLDDMFTIGQDHNLAALDSHRNFEIRIVNPFHRGTAGKVKSLFTGLSRVNRRMHNKSFTIDNQITIVGGRNISNQYFGAGKKKNFGDLDVAAVGPIVQEVSNSFDSYWNHQTALPLPAFIKELEDPKAALSALRQKLEESLQGANGSDYADAVRSKALTFIESGRNMLVWAPYRLAVDSPDKGIKAKAKNAVSITTAVLESLRSAEKDILIITPYFVPLKSGVTVLSEMQQSGVDVTIITNSLASNNQFTTHGGYIPWRKPLLQAGIKIYEARPDADIQGTEFINASGAKATLHTKAFIVDDKEVFIGSFNFDPRSANLNTEIGVIIREPDLALVYAAKVKDELRQQSFEVFLNDKGKVRWRGYDDGRETIYKKEPETSWRARFAAWVARILISNTQL